MKIIGHRGVISLAPENTFSACYALKSINKNWIETDVVLSKDNIPMIFHDKELNRCTNLKGNFKNFTLNELNNADAGSFFSRKFKNEKIPTLSEFIILCDKLDINIFLELKSYNNDNLKLVEEVAKRINKYYNKKQEIILCSYSREIIKHLNKLLPNNKKSLIVDEIPEDWEEFINDNNCYSINLSYIKNNISDINKCSMKIPVYCHVVNNTEHYNDLKNININGIITDNPELFI